MGISYGTAEDVQKEVEKIVHVLEMKHVDLTRVFCFRSQGTGSRNIIARCHSLPKILQQALAIEPAYVIEVISEKYDKSSEEDKIKTLIHELAHIPKTFGGGFIHHNVVRESFINKLYKKYLEGLRKYPQSFSVEDTPKRTRDMNEIKRDLNLGNWIDN